MNILKAILLLKQLQRRTGKKLNGETYSEYFDSFEAGTKMAARCRQHLE